MSPPVIIPPSAIIGTYLPLSFSKSSRAAAQSAIAVACGGTEVVTEKVVQTVVVEKEVVKEVEKIKEVEVEKVVIQEKEVPVDKVVTKEVVTKYTPKEANSHLSFTVFIFRFTNVPFD